MIRNLYWHDLPSQTTLDALPKFMWAKRGTLSAASNTVALMLYVVLHFMADEVEEEGQIWHVATASYEDLARAIGGRSRSLVSQGLQQLEDFRLIERIGSHQKRRYRLFFSQPGWFKLPCQAIVRSGVVLPFANLSLRSSIELYALKIYLYLAARRDNYKTYTLASYENICTNTGVPERYIRKALVMLTVCGLLANIDRERDPKMLTSGYGPNVYYLRGHDQLFKAGGVTPETSPSSPPSPQRPAMETLS